MRTRLTLFFLLAATALHARSIVITGATLIDLRDFGRSAHDVRGAVVVIEDGVITAAGPRSAVRVPKGATRIDAKGLYIVPGYIDGFAAQANQAFANAHLYMGVTSAVVDLETPLSRRAKTFFDAHPSPRLLPRADVSGRVRDGESWRAMTPDDARADVDRLAKAGARVILIHYWVLPDALRAAVQEAHAHGLTTLGELGQTTYYDAAEAGVDIFLHTSRYSLDLVEPALREKVALTPFGPARLKLYESYIAIPENDARLAAHAQRLTARHTLLMPTLSLVYLQLPDHQNPWKQPIAGILDPADIHLAADRETGQPAKPEDEVRDGFPEGTGLAMLKLDRAYRAAGARYLAGSGTSAFGTMPGISLHTELELLTRIGLTAREALAAATSNYAALPATHDVGRIAPGFRADVLLLDADPTADIHNASKIHTLILGGDVIDRDRLAKP